MPRRVYIQTVGCQMNVLDSELVAADLLRAGHELVPSLGQADTILFNTCSVRQHAEDKIYSALGRLKHIKDRHPHTIIGVLGCMAQKDQQQIFKRAPHVDLVIGPGQLGQLPAMLDRIDAAASGGTAGWYGSAGDMVGQADYGTSQISLVGLPVCATPARADLNVTFAPFQPPRIARARPLRHQAMVRVVLGCNKLCTYCIVPRVRGPEQSRPAADVEAEVRRLVDEGCVEVTLLGQTVNSYRDHSDGRTLRLADLVYQLHDITGLRRLKFVTNHPQHMTTELLQAVRDLPKVSPYLHVPAQSGSDRVLQRMKRSYTAESYRAMLAQIHEMVPKAAVTSDLIVGFCGETEDDFQQTAELVRQARFKNSFIFKYSTRPGTKAAELYADDVPEEVKRRRNNELLAIQNAISLEDNQCFFGRQVEILVEGPSKVGRKQGPDAAASAEEPVPTDVVQLVGRTICDQIVVFDGPHKLAGQILQIKIEKVDAFTLFGKLEDGGP
jgi:tRNA-2-methylthio-N6-dimethylallyladenosine synthase